MACCSSLVSNRPPTETAASSYTNWNVAWALVKLSFYICVKL